MTEFFLEEEEEEEGRQETQNRGIEERNTDTEERELQEQ